MKNMNRRDFIKLGIAGSGMLGTSWLHAQCKDSGSISEPAAQINADVAAVCGTDLDTMTRDVLAELGGIEKIIDPGDTVFLKPNFVTIPWAQQNNCFWIGECTKPEIILAVTEECLKAGAAKVIIGEGSHLPTFDWRFAVTLDGSRNLVTESERLNAQYPGTVSLACLETDSPEWVELPSQTHHGKIAVSGLAAHADKVISIPVAKTHAWAQLTLASKNFLGITPLSRYAQFVDNSWWNRGSFDHSSPQSIAQVYLDITKGLAPDLSIIDFSIGIEGDGPTTTWGGTTIDMKEEVGTWAIIASTDIMAADATAARIMNHDVSNIEQLTMGYEMGLGEIRANAIELHGDNIENIRTAWKPARIRG